MKRVLMALLVCWGDWWALGLSRWPPGFSIEQFPLPQFDADAPFCMPRREPCGFYSFPLVSSWNPPLKWVKSWCRCAEGFECVFDRTDLKMRVYRQMCAERADIDDETAN